MPCFARWKERDSDHVLPEEKIPDKFIDALLMERRIGEALQYLNQPRLVSFDMAIHQPWTHVDAVALDVLEVFNRMKREILPFDDLTDGNNSWGHGYTQDTYSMSEHHAACYSHLLSVAQTSTYLIQKCR